MSAHAQSASSGTAPTTLASAALPARVRHILEAVNALAAQSLSTSLNLALNEFERQLFKQADRARSSQHQAEHFSELQHLRQHRADLVPRYLAGLEASLARLREAPETELPLPEAPEDPLQFQRLTLVEDTDLDRDIVLREIARRESQRGGTPLLLLGQRFGVLAARPGFDPERLPVGMITESFAALCETNPDGVRSGNTDHGIQGVMSAPGDEPDSGTLHRQNRPSPQNEGAPE